jgi:uncharacterized ubiquitin-like protein YukD
MPEHVDITFVAGARRTDLRIPTGVSVRRLLDELSAIFPGLTTGAVKLQLRIRAKGLLLTEEDVLSAHPVTTGDVVELDTGRTGPQEDR